MKNDDAVFVLLEGVRLLQHVPSFLGYRGNNLVVRVHGLARFYFPYLGGMIYSMNHDGKSM